MSVCSNEVYDGQDGVLIYMAICQRRNAGILVCFLSLNVTLNNGL